MIDWLYSAKERMDMFERRKREHPNAHPCYRNLFLGEALWDLYMAEVYKQDGEEIETLRNKIKSFIDEEKK